MIDRQPDMRILSSSFRTRYKHDNEVGNQEHQSQRGPSPAKSSPGQLKGLK